MAGYRGLKATAAQPARAVRLCAAFVVLLMGADRVCAGKVRPAKGSELVLESPSAQAEARRLLLKHRWTGEKLDVIYKIGSDYQPDVMAQIDWFMRDWRCNEAIVMDPKLIDRLYAVQKSAGWRRPIIVISAYRSEGYNASLLLAGRTVDPNSQHMSGRAVDIYAPGIGIDRLGRIAEENADGGTGLYPFSGPKFVHLDTGPLRKWTETNPAEIRKLNLPKRERKPLKLDCSMTMAQALHDIPLNDVLASLPVGAAAAGKPETPSLAIQGHGNVATMREGPCELSSPPQRINPSALFID